MQQHLLPRKTIARFCGADGHVQVQLLTHGLNRRYLPTDSLFCAQRAWDQRGESVVGGGIEIPYQSISDSLVDGSLASLAPEMHEAITQMYLLWRRRCLRLNDPMPDFRPKGVTPNDLPLDVQERMEKAGVAFIRPDGTIAGRVIAGFRLQVDIDSDWLAGAHAMRWGVQRCPPGLELLVPDAFIEQPVLPVAPELCLVAGLPDRQMTRGEVAELNRAALRAATRYWLARESVRCPS